jgi:hypothetical protein
MSDCAAFWKKRCIASKRISFLEAVQSRYLPILSMAKDMWWLASDISGIEVHNTPVWVACRGLGNAAIASASCITKDQSANADNFKRNPRSEEIPCARLALPGTVAANTNVHNYRSRHYEAFARTEGTKKLLLPSFEAATEVAFVLSPDYQLRISEAIAGAQVHTIQWLKMWTHQHEKKRAHAPCKTRCTSTIHGQTWPTTMHWTFA